MMKKLIAVLLALAMVLSLAACGGKENSSDTPENENPVAVPGETEAAGSQEQAKEDVQMPVNGEISEAILRNCPETPVSEFTYAMSSDYEGILIQSYNGTSDVVVIPAIIDGQPVVDIGEYVFANSSTVKAVLIPETVVEIGELFTNNVNIKLVVAEGLQILGNSCFLNCSALETVIVGDDLAEIRDLAFFNCFALAKLNVPASLTEMTEGARKTAFYGCGTLTIYGEAGSYIETVAGELGIPFVAE